MNLQWEDSLLLKGTADIEKYFNNDEAKLFIMAKGFDPRMCQGLKCMLAADSNTDIILINYSETPKSSSHDYVSDSNINLDEFKGLCREEKVKEVKFLMWREEGGRKTSLVKKNLEREFTSELLMRYNEVIVDMSAMPRSIYAVLVRILNKRKKGCKLSVMVCENSVFDDSITPTNAFEDAGYLNGIGAFSIGSETDNDKNTLWFPMLGTGAEETVKKIADFIKPNEICPILPFPSMDASRSDRILTKYEDVLFKTLEVEMKNIIYVSEFNPLSTYKKLCTAVFYYAESLSILNKKEDAKATKFIFSMQSSKLMEVGLLLAVLELIENKYKVGIAVVENEGYKMDKNKYDESKNELYCLCLDTSIFD